MFELGKVFQASILGLLCLGSVMFAIAEGSPLPQTLTIPFAIFAYTHVERRKNVTLPTLGANILGIIACMVALAEFLGWLAMQFGPFSLFSPNSVEARLLSVAHLIVYISWIVLYIERQMWHYWLLCGMSILQVAVASVLTNDASFGLLLLIYLAFAIWTLAVFSLYQAERRFARRDLDGDVELDSGDAGDAVSVRAAGTFDVDNIRSLRRPSSSRGMIQHDLHDQWVNPRFAGGVGLTVVGSFVIAAGFFLFIPRVWIGERQFGSNRLEAARSKAPLTGFTEEVSLGDMGQILESSEQVLSLRMFDRETNAPIDPETYAQKSGFDEPYFRGKTLDVYSSGRWTVDDSERRDDYLRANVPNTPVRQEIVLQPIGTRVLFGLFPFMGGEMKDQDFIEVRDGRTLMAPISAGTNRIKEYSLFGPAAGREVRLGDGVKHEHRQNPEDSLPRLAELARQIVSGDSEEPVSQKDAADRIVAYLKSAEFGYTLDVSIKDPSIDPVEDFLFNRKEGHCEYYAAALALMLRAAGVPSRLVSGFKGGELDPDSGEFNVQQRHAHAWVEAHINGHWQMLDATPANERRAVVQQQASEVGVFRRMANFGRQLWYSSMVTMTFEQQQASLYSPLQDLMEDLTGGWREGGSRTANALKDLLSSPSRWFSLQGGVVAFLFLTTAVFVVWAGTRIGRLMRSARWKRGRWGRRPSVEFYERFQKLCRKQGLIRGNAETQREFAATVTDKLAPRLASRGMKPFPDRLINAFYRVRFGEQRLDEQEYDLLNRQLAEFEDALASQPAKV